MNANHITPKSTFSRRSVRERGATLLEFAIVFPTLFVLLIAIIDFSRLLLVGAILSKGAENGLNLAKKLPYLETDFRNKLPTDPDYQNFLNARRRVLFEAKRLPLSVIATDWNSAASGGVKLLPFKMVDTGVDVGLGNPAPDLTYGAALIRPGEQVTFEHNASSHTVNHKTLPPIPDPPSQSVENLVTGHPITVELRAQVDMWLPFLGTLIARGSASGYREVIPRGPLPPPDPADPDSDIVIAAAVTITSSTVPVVTSTVPSEPCAGMWPQCIRQSKVLGTTHCPRQAGGVCSCSPCSGTAAAFGAR
jgi:hypothetical protein